MAEKCLKTEVDQRIVSRTMIHFNSVKSQDMVIVALRSLVINIDLTLL